MGIRLEIILPLIVSLIVAAIFLVKIDTYDYKKQKSTKELEFNETTLMEVDTNRTLGLAHCNHGIYENSVWTLSKVTYYTDSIEYLKADKAAYQEDTVYLDGNVTLYQRGGYHYETQHAVYHKKKEEIEITSPFTATLGENIIRGDWLLYKIKQKEGFARKINAVVYTNEK